MTQRTTILIGCPCHGSQLEWKTASAIHAPSKRTDLNILKIFSNSSLLATNFNRIWATAHNWNEEHPNEKVKWFFLLHGDIIPEDNWVDKMIALAEQYNTDLLSVVVPFKDQSGLTSTALGREDDAYNIVSRLTMQQVMQLPPTFNNADVALMFGINTLPMPPLLVNSGCIIVNMEMPRARELYFTINDQVRTDQQGKLYPVTEPEDWFFARMVRDMGGNVMATREVKVAHVGTRHYNNDQVWGATWDEHYMKNNLNHSNPMDGTIWNLEEAKMLHVHSPGLAQWLVDYLDFRIPVYDFGCGKGTYVAELRANDFDATGFEGTEGIKAIADTDFITQQDITKPFVAGGGRGSVLCLEVMEHIHAKDEFNVLLNINSHCKDTLVLSWAVEGQNGFGHINCRNADYVVPTIEALGFKVDFVKTIQARFAATTNGGPAFFNDSLYVFKKL